MKKIIIVDLDNCICDDEERMKLVHWDKQHPHDRWYDYHAEAGKSPIKNFELIKDRPVVVFTARPESFRRLTWDWIQAHGIQCEFLMMRGDNDHRSAVEVKRRMVRDLGPAGIKISDVEIAFDDRQDICDMYREFGIPTQRVAIHERTRFEDIPATESGPSVQSGIETVAVFFEQLMVSAARFAASGLTDASAAASIARLSKIISGLSKGAAK